MVEHKYITRVSVERGCLRGRGLQVPTAGLTEGFREGGSSRDRTAAEAMKRVGGFLTGWFVSIRRSRVCRRR